MGSAMYSLSATCSSLATCVLSMTPSTSMSLKLCQVVTFFLAVSESLTGTFVVSLILTNSPVMCGVGRQHEHQEQHELQQSTKQQQHDSAQQFLFASSV